MNFGFCGLGPNGEIARRYLFKGTPKTTFNFVATGISGDPFPAILQLLLGPIHVSSVKPGATHAALRRRSSILAPRLLVSLYRPFNSGSVRFPGHCLPEGAMRSAT
jgi:hypothetical protein